MNNTQVLWDNVPANVKDQLAERGDVKQNGIAIVDTEGASGKAERWYFKRVAGGWNNTAVDRDLSPAQREAALRGVARVEEAMRIKNLAGRKLLDQSKVDLGDVLRDPCPASTGAHSFNMDEWIPDDRGVPRKWGRCACGALAPIDPPEVSMGEAKKIQDQLAKALARGIARQVVQKIADELMQKVKDAAPVGTPHKVPCAHKFSDRGQVDVTLDLRAEPGCRWNLNSRIEQRPQKAVVEVTLIGGGEYGP